MAVRQYILLNFLHGNSPYLRTTELAIAVNDELAKLGKPRMGIVVPLVYGDSQEKIMRENFATHIARYPDELLFEETLGGKLYPIFYDGKTTYEDSLKFFLANQRTIERDIQNYIEGGLTVRTVAGVELHIAKKDIAMEISRCPQVHYGLSRSYFTGFDYISEVLARALEDKNLGFNKNLLTDSIPLYEELERKQTLHFIAEPSIFSYLGNRPRKYPTEIFTPPNTNQLKWLADASDVGDLKKGIYVTITGVPGLTRLYTEALDLGLTIYTHRPELIAGSIKAPPSVLVSDQVLLHFARSGWGSVWLSQLTKTPFVAKPYTPQDDLEIYFNNICLERLGLAKVYRGENLKELLDYGVEFKDNVMLLMNRLMEKYGRVGGVEYIAFKITKDYLKLTG